jgi:hypothetical protein
MSLFKGLCGNFRAPADRGAAVNVAADRVAALGDRVPRGGGAADPGLK